MLAKWMGGVPIDAVPEIVSPRAPGVRGQWLDIDDGYPAANNADAWSHAETHPKHRWAWRNFETGDMEEP